MRWKDLIVAAAACVLTQIAAPLIARADEPEYVPHQALVRLQPTAAPVTFAASVGATITDSIPARNIYLLGLAPQIDEVEFVEAIRVDPRVVSAELNYIAEDERPGGTTQSFFLASSQQAYLDNPSITSIGLSSAHSVTRGAGVVVAVLDSGVDVAHPLLIGKIIGPAINLVDSSGSIADVGDGLDNDADGYIDEDVGHGTFVAGLVARVAPDAQILPVRIMDSDGQSTHFRLTQAIYLALDHGASVINISLGSAADMRVLRDSIEEASAAGVVVVAAAGNSDTDETFYPAALAPYGVLGVAATTAAGIKAPFSNYGSWVGISAPGSAVQSLIPGGGYGRADGSSFASPMVAGVAALVRSLCPLTTPEQLRSLITDAALPINALNPSYIGMLGAGRLSASRAVGASGGFFVPCQIDIDANGSLGIDDLYSAFGTPRDLNGDGAADANDTHDLEVFLRSRGTRPISGQPVLP